MPSFNQVTLIGHVGKDPEIRYLTGGDPVASFSVATSERWKKDGQQQERTDWHRVEAFGGLAKTIGEYVSKGSLVLVQGQVRYDEWTDKDGNKRNTTKIRASSVKFMDSKKKAKSDETQASDFQVSDSDVPF